MIRELLKIKKGIITNVIIGGSNGSIICFDIKLNELEFVLFVYCSWRLSESSDVLTSSADEENNFVKEIKQLQGLKIKDISLMDYGDFSIEFENKKLSIFCDSIFSHEKQEDWENWSLCDTIKNKCTVFDNKFKFKTEPYHE